MTLPLFESPLPAATTRLGKVARHFAAHPGQWVDGLAFEGIGGRYAWRSRIAECRTKLGMRIDNRQQRRPDGSVRSEYRYQPEG